LEWEKFYENFIWQKLDEKTNQYIKLLTNFVTRPLMYIIG